MIPAQSPLSKLNPLILYIMENIIHQTIEEFMSKLNCQINKLRIEKRDNVYKINLETSHPNLMIGHHGENIFALQHLLKLVVWKKNQDDSFDIKLDIDNYRRRQEEKVIDLAERKVDLVRKLSSAQSLPIMSPYFRRLVHLHLAQDKFKDIITESEGEGEDRYIVIKPELII
jgi:spoIIIJ-associated protein